MGKLMVNPGKTNLVTKGKLKSKWRVTKGKQLNKFVVTKGRLSLKKVNLRVNLG